MSDPGERTRLGDCYSVIGGLWCSSADVDVDEAREEASAAVEWLEHVDKESAVSLSRFLREAPISEETYIELFELDPKCALYLGSHVFDEPTTCAGAGVSDRNGYMIELLGVYRHFGRAPNGNELPDYLPLMVEFLSMTVQSSEDPVREKFVKEYVLPFLPPMRKRLKDIGTPYLHLLEAFERIVNHDLRTSQGSHVG